MGSKKESIMFIVTSVSINTCVPSSCSVFYLLCAFSLSFVSCRSVAHNKHEELNNNGQAQVIRHAISSAESTLKDQEFQRVIEQLIVSTEYSRQDSLLKCLIKSQMADHPQQWNDHSSDVRHFIGSFNYFQGDFETLFNISQGFDRYYIVLSEPEVSSWSTHGWIKSPRVSEEMSDHDAQVYHPIHMFNRIGDAVNHTYYLRVVHCFMFNSHAESAHGRYLTYSGPLRPKVRH